MREPFGIDFLTQPSKKALKTAVILDLFGRKNPNNPIIPDFGCFYAKTIQVSTNQFREITIIGDHHFVYWLSLTEFWRLSLTSFVTLVSDVDSCREKI